MAWTKNFLRTPTWPTIALQFVMGTVVLTLAILSVTRYWEQTVVHDDGLLAVLQAAVGGMLLGAGLEMLRHRVAVRRLAGRKAMTDD